jgi:hypothetical protein
MWYAFERQDAWELLKRETSARVVATVRRVSQDMVKDRVDGRDCASDDLCVFHVPFLIGFDPCLPPFVDQLIAEHFDMPDRVFVVEYKQTFKGYPKRILEDEDPIIKSLPLTIQNLIQPVDESQGILDSKVLAFAHSNVIRRADWLIMRERQATGEVAREMVKQRAERLND